MALIYTRHGETEWNLLGKIQGREDIPLSEKGKEQANQLKKELDGEKIDIIYCSPLQRAYQTALIVKGTRDIPLIKDNRIIEMNYGIYDGRQKDDPGLMKQRTLFAQRYPEGESYLDVAKRVYSFLDELKKKHPDANILIVAHLGIARVVNSYFHPMTNEEFIGFRIKNCQPVRYRFKE